MKCDCIWFSQKDNYEKPSKPCEGELFRVDEDTIACLKCEARFDK